MRMLGRMLWVCLAALLAATVGTLVAFTLGLELVTRAGVGAAAVGAGTDESEPDALRILQLWSYLYDNASPLWSLLLTFSVIPAIVVVIIGEIGRIRSLLYYLVAGGLAVAGIPALMRVAEGPLQPAQSTTLLVLATAGFAAGLAYWALAGRQA